MRHYLDIERYKEFHVGSPALHLDRYSMEQLVRKQHPNWSLKFRAFKIAFDYTCGIISVPTIMFLSVMLLILNPFFNPGPLFFRQARVGQFGKPFMMWKFRTMLPAQTEARDPNAKLETDRITKLGRLLRATRIDEIPNLINVLRGEMSVVGPRPEAASHAEYYTEKVFGYKERQRVKPGITGLAQVEQGYVEDEDATAIKAKYDNLYVERSCGRLDLYIIYRTFRATLGGFGAK